MAKHLTASVNLHLLHVAVLAGLVRQEAISEGANGAGGDVCVYVFYLYLAA